jgi:tetratricopeptide (TPR) repeat protein
MVILERDDLLARLGAEWQRARDGGGRLVLIEGEAGIGKTTLLRAFAQSMEADALTCWGACDALLTPRALGPLEDIAAGLGGELRRLLEHGVDRHRLFVAFVDRLAEQPTLVIIEDLHWADAATLDLLRYCGRRITRTHSLLVASLRSDELVPAHPLRAVLGDLATSGALRLAPQPLSAAAVQALCGERVIDAAELHRKTAGNPFFVTEVLAADGDGVPAVVQDAVFARTARLSASGRAVLDAAAVAGPRVELWLLQALTAAESASIEECLATGVLRADGPTFAFRHELARQALLQAMTPTRSSSLHRLVLQALLSRTGSQQGFAPDAARLSHHADAAGDAEAVLHWSPLAAREAAARGAHRQAAEHWARAIAHAPAGVARAPLLDEQTSELQISGSLEQAIAARRQAARLWREAGQAGPAAISLARLATLLVLAGRNSESEEALREARSLVVAADTTAATSTTAAAMAVQRAAAGLRMLSHDCEEAIALARPVLAYAEQANDRASVVQLGITLGVAELSLGHVDEGLAQFEHALAVAEAIPSDFSIGQVLTNLGAGCADVMQLDRAEAALRRGITFCAERDLDAMQMYQLSWLAHVHLWRGRWDEAADAAQKVMGDTRAATIARIMALVALGRLRARRGDPGVWHALDEARELARATGAVQRIAPTQAARAEAAWLEGRDADAASEAAEAMPLALAKRLPHHIAELALWSRRSGAQSVLPPECARHPAAMEAAGGWRAAADAWHALGCPYEAARALADGNESAQREALATFERLAARPMVERVRRHLRAAGVRGLPRGPRSITSARTRQA